MALSNWRSLAEVVSLLVMCSLLIVVLQRQPSAAGSRRHPPSDYLTQVIDMKPDVLPAALLEQLRPDLQSITNRANENERLLVVVLQQRISTAESRHDLPSDYITQLIEQDSDAVPFNLLKHLRADLQQAIVDRINEKNHLRVDLQQLIVDTVYENNRLVVVALQQHVSAAGSRPNLPSEYLAQKSVALEAALLELRPILQQSIVDRVNGNKLSTWKAGHNPRFDGVTVGDFKNLCGTIKGLRADVATSYQKVSLHMMKAMKHVVLPVSFDAREAWPRCESIGTILDQGHCGSCWAFSATQPLSDRFCIHGFENVTLSVNDLIACCGSYCGLGCNGGDPYRAWNYFKHKGVVTDSCDPYFDTTGCTHPGRCDPMFPTPACTKSCVGDDEVWTKSKHYTTSAYIVDSDPQQLMLELYTNGPFAMGMEVYEDFAHYKSGVYQYATGLFLGMHGVKVIGWGTTEDGLDYWTVVNSWNTGWGDDGLFRILRGSNECDIENWSTAGIPRLKGLKTSDV